MGDMKWYVLRTAGSKEKKAKDYLEKEIERFGLQDQVAQILDRGIEQQQNDDERYRNHDE